MIRTCDWRDKGAKLCCLDCLFHNHIHFLRPPLKKEGHIALHLSVGWYASLPFLLQECFPSEAINLTGDIP